MLKWFFSGPFLKINYKIFVKDIRGLENIPEGSGFIISSNHSSYLDIILMSAVLTIKKNLVIRYLAKKELFSYWIFRKLQKIFHGIPIDRELKGKEALRHAIKALKKGDIVGIYPEGGRSLTGKIQRGKTGVARLALWASVPVVPVGIKGAFELMPQGKIIPKFRKNIVLKIGKPMYFKKYSNKPMTKRLLRKITDEIMEEIAMLSGQRYNP